VKRFGATTALDDVSVSIGRGELFGFIGPDGGGKTTLFRILVTLLVPESGTARVLGRDVVKDLWDLRRRIGYMPGRFSLYPDLSVEENIRFFASVFGTTLEREYEQIAPIYTQLEPFKTRRSAALSGGMKQKLALCCALVHRPEIYSSTSRRRASTPCRGASSGISSRASRRRTHHHRLDAVHGRSQSMQPRRAHAARTNPRHRHSERDHRVVRPTALRGSRRRSLPRVARAA
jgi:hypothetical protein